MQTKVFVGFLNGKGPQRYQKNFRQGDFRKMATQDVWEAAANPEVKSTFDYFGLVKVDTYFCVLVKGQGKIPYDPGQHTEDQRRTSIEIVVIPLAEQNIQFDVSRSMIAESREWAGIVLPSIKNLGISPKELNGRYAHLRTKETGETYVSQRGKHAGETRAKTTFEFVAVYGSEAECRAAYQAYTSGAGSTPAASTPPPINGNGSNPVADAAKDTALKFLKVIVDNACRGQKDMNVIRTTITANLANMPMVNSHFTVDSPETMELVLQAMQK
jgi:hypothetical protein